MSRPALTDRQQAAYNFIRDYLRRNGYSPSIREIGDALGIVSTNGVVGHLLALENKGYIVRDADKARTIALASPDTTLAEIKLSTGDRLQATVRLINAVGVYATSHRMRQVDGLLGEQRSGGVWYWPPITGAGRQIASIQFV